MVKGTTQRVVVVRAKGGALFDEAIFLIRPGMEQECAVTDQMLLDEARRAAAPELGRAADWKAQILFALGGAGVPGLPGARRYLGQAAAFRLAWDGDPALLDGFTQERAGLLTVPAEKRKPCLAHLMTQAAQGNAAAQEVFRRVGRHIGQINREMAPLLLPRTNVRYLFGRFVKEPACFRLLQEGCREIVPELVLEAADEELSVTPLMQALAERHTTRAFSPAMER